MQVAVVLYIIHAQFEAIHAYLCMYVYIIVICYNIIGNYWKFVSLFKSFIVNSNPRNAPCNVRKKRKACKLRQQVMSLLLLQIIALNQFVLHIH